MRYIWRPNCTASATKKPLGVIVLGLLLEDDRRNMKPLSPMGERGGGKVYLQPGNLKETICVLQLKLPVEAIYSVVYQKVQSSTGSITIAL